MEQISRSSPHTQRSKQKHVRVVFDQWAAVEFLPVYPVRCAEREKNGCGIRDAGGYPEEERPWSNDDISTLIEDSRTW